MLPDHPPVGPPTTSHVISSGLAIPERPPTLQAYRLTDDRLTLYLTLDDTSFTRRIKLGGPDAGLCCLLDLGRLAVFARGRRQTCTSRAGRHPAYQPYHRAFSVQGTPVQLEAMATEVWPVMRRLVLKGADPWATD